jgi:pyruvate/2-oxoglutarate dehydrogenase complex dihydrolipoamide dehydrogenase (E3) component
MKLAAGLELKADLKKYYEYAVRQTLKDEGVKVKLNTEATLETVKAETPDAIIVAVGADPILPPVPGSDKDKVVWVGDADTGKAEIGNTVVIAGAGATGAETALQYAIDGKDVTLIDGLDYAKTIVPEYPRGLSLKLEEYKIKILDQTMLLEVTDEGAVVITKDRKRVLLPADTVILSLGFKPRKELAHSFDEITTEVYYAGDCVKVGDIYTAVHGGFDIAVEI